jgi:CHAD domain-containing protein
VIAAGDDSRENAASRLLGLFDELTASRVGLSAEDIHRVRVAIKQTRAWLKLCRALTGKTAGYQQVVKNLGSLSHALSGQRDQYVACQTLRRLGRKYPGKKTQQLIEALSQQWVSMQTPVPDAASLQAVIEQIRRELLPFTRLPLPRATQVSVLRRAYPKMCQAGHAALASETCVELHAWRKRVKTLGYQVAMLESPLPRAKKLLKLLNKLGSRLGEIHDLCFLQEMVEDADAQGRLALEPAPLLKRIHRERRRLTGSARKQHARVCPLHAQWFAEA